MMKFPNSVDAIIAFGWIESYFNLVGDTESNFNEIHLDPVTITSIYDKYCFDMGCDVKSMPNCGMQLVHVCHIYDGNIEERSNVS